MENFFKWFSKEARAAGFEYLLIGGNAVNAYGYQRTTLDVDFVVLKDDRFRWKEFLMEGGYRCFHETEVFCQFESADATLRLPVDLMFVDGGTFEKLSSLKEYREVGDTELPVPAALHIIALKLHAMRDVERAAQGKDMLDVIGLIEICGLDTDSVEFVEILDRYAAPVTREELFRRLDIRRRL